MIFLVLNNKKSQRKNTNINGNITGNHNIKKSRILVPFESYQFLGSKWESEFASGFARRE